MARARYVGHTVTVSPQHAKQLDEIIDYWTRERAKIGRPELAYCAEIVELLIELEHDRLSQHLSFKPKKRKARRNA